MLNGNEKLVFNKAFEEHVWIDKAERFPLLLWEKQNASFNKHKFQCFFFQVFYCF